MRWFRRPQAPVVVVNNYLPGTGEVEQLLAAITTITERIEMLDLSTLTTEVAETRGAVDSAVTLIGSLRSEVASVSARIVEALNAESVAESEAADLRAALESAQAQIDALVSSLDEGQADLANAIGSNPDVPDENPAETPTPEGEQPVEETPAQTDPQPEVEVPTNGNEGTTPEIVVDEGTPAQATSTDQDAEGDSGVTDGSATADNGGTGAGEVTTGEADIAPGTEDPGTVVE